MEEFPSRPLQTLRTLRLQLRSWRPADLEPFAELNADPVAMEFFPQTLHRQESDALAHRCQAHLEQYGWGLWAVESCIDSSFLGFVGLRPIPVELPFAPAVEIGWRLRKQFWGKGFAFEAASAALRFGFDQLQLPEIVSFTAILNQRSWSLMERLGMQRIGEFEHPQVMEGHALRPHYLYRMTDRRYQLKPD